MRAKGNRAISAKEAQRMLRDLKPSPMHSLDTELKQEGLDYLAYQLDEGRVLLVSISDKTGVIYTSLEALRTVIGLANESIAVGPVHILKGCIADPESFLLSVDAQIDVLTSRLSLSPQTLDGSIESLDRLSEAFNTLSDTTDFSFRDAVLPLTVYSGNVIMRNVHGFHWRVDKDHAVDVWEPYVVDNTGTRLNLWLPMAKEHSLDGRVNLRAIVEHELARLSMAKP